MFVIYSFYIFYLFFFICNFFCLKLLFWSAVELTCSVSDAWLSLAITLQLYKYIAKQDYETFSSASCGWNHLIMMDCMALSNNNNLRIKSKHLYLGLRIEGCIWIKKLFESTDLSGSCSVPVLPWKAISPVTPPSWLDFFYHIQVEFDLAISIWKLLLCWQFYLYH